MKILGSCAEALNYINNYLSVHIQMNMILPRLHLVEHESKIFTMFYKC